MYTGRCWELYSNDPDPLILHHSRRWNTAPSARSDRISKQISVFSKHHAASVPNHILRGLLKEDIERPKEPVFPLIASTSPDSLLYASGPLQDVLYKGCVQEEKLNVLSSLQCKGPITSISSSGALVSGISTVELFTLENLQPYERVAAPGRVYNAILTLPSRLVFACSDSQLHYWDVKKQCYLRSWKTPSMPHWGYVTATRHPMISLVTHKAGLIRVDERCPDVSTILDVSPWLVEGENITSGACLAEGVMDIALSTTSELVGLDTRFTKCPTYHTPHYGGVNGPDNTTPGLAYSTHSRRVWLKQKGIDTPFLMTAFDCLVDNVELHGAVRLKMPRNEELVVSVTQLGNVFAQVVRPYVHERDSVAEEYVMLEDGRLHINHELKSKKARGMPVGHILERCFEEEEDDIPVLDNPAQIPQLLEANLKKFFAVGTTLFELKSALESELAQTLTNETVHTGFEAFILSSAAEHVHAYTIQVPNVEPLPETSELCKCLVESASSPCTLKTCLYMHCRCSILLDPASEVEQGSIDLSQDLSSLLAMIEHDSTAEDAGNDIIQKLSRAWVDN